MGQFSFALSPLTYGKGGVLGQCLNINDVNNIVRDVQNRLIERGYTTTRVLVGNQNLSERRLVLTIVAGIVEQIKADTKSSSVPVYTDNTGLPANFKTALSFKAGDVLNIHHLETAFENLKRVPSSAGKYQGDITPSFDNPMWHNDLLHLTYGRDLGNDINKGEYTHKSAKGGSENYKRRLYPAS